MDDADDDDQWFALENWPLACQFNLTQTKNNYLFFFRLKCKLQ